MLFIACVILILLPMQGIQVTVNSSTILPLMFLTMIGMSHIYITTSSTKVMAIINDLNSYSIYKIKFISTGFGCYKSDVMLSENSKCYLDIVLVFVIKATNKLVFMIAIISNTLLSAILLCNLCILMTLNPEINMPCNSERSSQSRFEFCVFASIYLSCSMFFVVIVFTAFIENISNIKKLVIYFTVRGIDLFSSYNIIKRPF